jgi:hypothetical protein
MRESCSNGGSTLSVRTDFTIELASASNHPTIGSQAALLAEPLEAVRDLRPFVPLVRELCHRQGERLEVPGDA